jgi:hypothetical protein
MTFSALRWWGCCIILLLSLDGSEEKNQLVYNKIVGVLQFRGLSRPQGNLGMNQPHPLINPINKTIETSPLSEIIAWKCYDTKLEKIK